MKIHKWTLGLAALGLVTLPSTSQAEEKPNMVLTALSSTTISGYVNASAHWVPGTGNANPPPYGFNTPTKQDGFNLNVVQLNIEKPLDEGTWSAGYRVELWMGPDAVGYNPSPGVGGSDLSVKQAYVALRAPVGNGIDFKMGVFDTIIGYEVPNAGSNPNYTRSYGWTIEPTQHTGLLASYQVNNVVGVAAGVANTHSAGINARAFNDQGEQRESYKTYMGAITLTAPESMGSFAGSILYLGAMNGNNPAVGADMTSWYAGVTLNTPIKALKVGASYDYTGFSGQPLTDGASAYANATALYVSYQFTDKLSWHNRAEYASSSPFLIPKEVFALTSTLQYDLWANVLTRLEVRWDHSLSGPEPFGGNTPGVGNRKNEVLVAGNVIYKF